MAEPAGGGVEGAPAVGDPVLDRDYLATLEALRTPKGWSQGLLLIGSLALFVLFQQGRSPSVRGLAILLAVLLFHELGHFAGMRLFGYRDVKMFFIPFFGAAVSGRRSGVAAWKQGVVLLLGPVPGILAAVALEMGPAPFSPAVRELAISLVSINGFNLVPLAGLDGARLIEHLLFSGSRWLQVVFRVCAALAMAAVALALQSYVLGFFALALVAVLPVRWRVLGAAARLRAAGLPLPEDARSLEGKVGYAVFEEAREAITNEQQRRPRAMAALMDQILDAATAKRPTLVQIAVLLLVWLVALALTLVGLALVVRHGGAA